MDVRTCLVVAVGEREEGWNGGILKALLTWLSSWDGIGGDRVRGDRVRIRGNRMYGQDSHPMLLAAVFRSSKAACVWELVWISHKSTTLWLGTMM